MHIVVWSPPRVQSPFVTIYLILFPSFSSHPPSPLITSILLFICFFLCSTYKWKYVVLFSLPYSLGMILKLSWSFHVVTNAIFYAFYSCMYYFLFIQSYIKGYLSCFYVLATVNNVTVNISIHIFLWVTVFKFSR